MLKTNLGVFAVTAVLILFNFISIYVYNLEYFDETNCVVVLLLFIVFLYNKCYINFKLCLAFVLALLANISLIYYENFVFSLLTNIFKLLFYIVLMWHVIPLQKSVKTTRLDWFSYIFVSLLGCGVIKVLISSIEQNLESGLNMLFYIHGLFLICIMVIAFRYNSTGFKGAKYFALLLVLFAFSDIFSSFGYYLGYDNLSYFERFFYTMGLCFTILYSKKYIQKSVTNYNSAI
ncbi:hypothetical protein FUA26_11950 [Seonamhaeicola algicola]|uniref:YhhN-like protein n=1 Tax=Seonamhaeicola algicola TaxID=1719036 RepID=A0A5C7AP93_9FLAO|nr:hypothetical protein [Seonamhaeicola algicola]TXE10177.1 hypothetical protein FUA26_11950 [Seonamhaeicola algicola]